MPPGRLGQQTRGTGPPGSASPAPAQVMNYITGYAQVMSYITSYESAQVMSNITGYELYHRL